MGSITTPRLGIRPKQLSSSENISLQQYYYGERSARSAEEQKPFKRRRVNRLKNDTEMDIHVKCTACPKVFKKNSEIISHVFEHIEPDETGQHVIRERRHPLRQSNLRCYICMKKTTMDSISIHIKHSHEMKNHEFTCRICELFYGNKRDLVMHMHHTHPCLDMPYACDICGYQSSFRTAVFKHFEETHQKNYVMCSFCMTIMPVEDMRDMKMLESHLMEHVLSNGERCIRCALKFTSVGQLQDHLAQKHQRLSDATKIEDIKIYKLVKGEDPILMRRPVRRDPRAPRSSSSSSTASSTSTAVSTITSATAVPSQSNHQYNQSHFTKLELQQETTNESNKTEIVDIDSDDGLEIVYERIVAPTQHSSDSARSVIQCAPSHSSSQRDAHLSKILAALELKRVTVQNSPTIATSTVKSKRPL